MKLRVLSWMMAGTLLISMISIPSMGASNKVVAQQTLTLEQAQQTLSNNRGFFTENKGQWDPNILFIGNTDFGKVAFTKEAIYYQMIEVEEQVIDPIHDRLDPLYQKPASYSSNIIQLSFVSAESPEIEGLELLPHYHNYFIGNDSSKWATECRNYAQVTYSNVWEGIDLAYFFSPEGLKYEYYVHPHAQIEDLRVQVEGAELKNKSDTLHMETTLGTMKDDHLLVFGQDTQKPLPARFQVEGSLFSFVGIPSQRTETIVIDPLVYSTYLGGSSDDYAYSIAVDALGYAYVAGHANSSNFPMSTTLGGPPAPGYDQSHNGGADAFVVKLNPSGTQLLYATFLGGSSDDYAFSIAVDSAGNAYVTGRTESSDLPMSTTLGGPPAPGYDQSHNGQYDAFVVKLNPSGTQLLYATFLGGSESVKFFV